MSYTELHTGKFKIVAKGVDEIDTYASENNLTGQVERKEYNGKVSYYIDNSEGYDIVNVKGTPVMIKYDYHTEDEAYDFVSHMDKNPDGSYNFIMMFHNGGTCLSEMLAYELKDLI